MTKMPLKLPLSKTILFSKMGARATALEVLGSNLAENNFFFIKTIKIFISKVYLDIFTREF